MLQKLGVNVGLLPYAVRQQLDDIDLTYKLIAGEEAVLLCVWPGTVCFKAATHNLLLLVERLKAMFGEGFDVRIERLKAMFGEGVEVNTVCIDYKPV